MMVDIDRPVLYVYTYESISDLSDTSFIQRVIESLLACEALARLKVN